MYTPEKSIIEYTEDGWTELVCYTDDIDPTVIEDIVEIYNAGQGIESIDEYLFNKDKCTQDEKDFIMESITVYLKSKQMDTTLITEQLPLNTTPIAEDSLLNTLPGFLGTELGTPVAEPVKAKKTWSRKPTDSSIKTVSPADYIKVLQEKMDIVRLLDAVEMPEIPTALTKANRDIMLEFQKEHGALITKYMDKIQKA